MKQVLRAFFTMTLPVLLVLTMVLFNPAPSALAQSPLVRVGLTISGNYLLLTMQDGDNLINMKTGSAISLPSGIYRLENTGTGIQIRNAAGSSQGIFSGPIHLTPANGSFTIGNGRFGTAYRGLLEIGMGHDNALVVVNVVDLESYLRGVVPREMPSIWGNNGGMEALKAQAVVARSFALYHIRDGRHEADSYELCDRQHCQVYGGMNAETANTDAAVAATQGIVLTWNGQVVAAYYHSNNGGHTECPANVWVSTLPYLRSEPDSFDDPRNPANMRHRAAIWEMDVPLSILNGLLAGQAVPVPVDSVRVESEFASGRVNELRISGGGQSVSLFRGRARTALGLRSQLFQVREAPEPRVWIASAAADGSEIKQRARELAGKWAKNAAGHRRALTGNEFSAQAALRRATVPYMAFIFEGRGWGHGIGMSQFGAFNRSRAGHDFREILSFYYPGTKLLSAF